MDFSAIDVPPAAVAVWTQVRAFLDQHVTHDVHKHERNTGDGLNVGLHRALGAQGWLAPLRPASEGGIDADSFVATVIARELESHRVPLVTHVTSMLVEPTIRELASPELRAEVLPGMASGDVLIALGYTEPDAGSDLANIRTRAIQDGTEWIVTGQKMFTSSAHNCQYCFIIARTSPDAPRHRGMTMFLVPMAAEGIQVMPVRTLGGERTNMLYLDAVHVADRYRIGDVDQGWSVLNGRTGALNLEHGSDEDAARLDGATLNNSSIAVLRLALHSAVAWARTPGVDGSLPIDDVRVRQQLAQTLLDIELGEIAPPVFSRVITSDLLATNALALLELLGPDGLVGAEGDDGGDHAWVEYAHRFAPGTAIYGGTVEIYRNLIAERMLGLPRCRPSP